MSESYVGRRFVEIDSIYVHAGSLIIINMDGTLGYTDTKDTISLSRLMKSIEKKQWMESFPGMVWRDSTPVILCNRCVKKYQQTHDIQPWEAIVEENAMCDVCSVYVHDARTIAQIVAKANK